MNNPYICPIGLEEMKDPVVASDGHSYDRHNIEKWSQHSKVSPISREPMTTFLVNNIALRGSNYKPHKLNKLSKLRKLINKPLNQRQNQPRPQSRYNNDDEDMISLVCGIFCIVGLVFTLRTGWVGLSCILNIYP